VGRIFKAMNKEKDIRQARQHLNEGQDYVLFSVSRDKIFVDYKDNASLNIIGDLAVANKDFANYLEEVSTCHKKPRKMERTQKVQIETIKLDPSNPRSITKEKFEELKQSIKDFPEMEVVKPLVIADDFVIGGNMRLLAYKDLGYREVHVIDVTAWSQAKRDEFMIKDNTHFGSWDYDMP
jgi:hypothetical protein